MSFRTNDDVANAFDVGRPMHSAGRFGTVGEREFIALMAFITAMSALAIDTMLPAFGAMRETFELSPDSTRLSLTVTLFLVGSGLGLFVFGPLADSAGRKRVLRLSLALYAGSALLAACAPNLTVLYVSRFAWGFAAAGPRVLAQAIVRDRYSGPQLARTMTLIQTFFALAPIFGPIIGRAILGFASWRWVFGFGTIIAIAAAAWGLRLPETLEPADRRTLSFGSTITGFRAAMTHPVTRNYALAIACGFGAFFSFLGSSELIFTDLYAKDEWFVPYFSAKSVVMSALAFTASRLLRRIRPETWAFGAGVSFVSASVVLLVATLASNGLPNFWFFLAVYTVAVLSHASMFPTATSVALHPMGALAGTAAAAIGILQSILGAALASLIDRSIDGSLVPIAVGFVTYSTLGLIFQWRGRRALQLQPD